VVAARFTVRLKSLGEAHRFAKRSAIPNAPVINRLMKLKYPALRQNVRTRLRRALLPCPSAALGEATKFDEGTHIGRFALPPVTLGLVVSPVFRPRSREHPGWPRLYVAVVSIAGKS